MSLFVVRLFIHSLLNAAQRAKLATQWQWAKNLSHWVTSFRDRVTWVCHPVVVLKCSDFCCYRRRFLHSYRYRLSSEDTGQVCVWRSLVRVTLYYYDLDTLAVKAHCDLSHYNCRHKSPVYSETRAIRCHAVKNAWSRFWIDCRLSSMSSTNETSLFVRFLIIWDFFLLSCTTCHCAVFILFCKRVQLLSHAAQSRCTVVRPIQKSIGKWEIRPPVKS